MIRYTDYKEEDSAELKMLIRNLYIEDTECTAMSEEKINKTIDYLTTHPDMGKIFLFKQADITIGYAILIHFWSNEYGGFVVHIDELYVKESFRNRGIATDFINHLASTGYNHAVALFLEVTPSNDNAYRLYQRIGFHEQGRRFLIKMLSQEVLKL